MHEAWVGAEGDFLWRHYSLKHFGGHGRKLRWNHWVHLTMTLQNGDILVRAATRCLMKQQHKHIHMTAHMGHIKATPKLTREVRFAFSSLYT